ncbi:PREDICTED: probable serine/threonine-protein kinase At1g18390 isoform X2 [Populus euphratica]|uniref:non-specific serine/threonine protein kinase n=1 Tax=Populus euphratica TaxID=75702 RepID=A0AAJ6TBI4_POPEU|nr:PREDICTED: probable serine/threonine-protein kinase At1g18390 isoform X2 [Populus euphratica]
MDPNNSFAFRKLLSIYNCIFLFTYLATQTVSQHPKFKSCEPKNCGAGPNISYPFWLPQEQESFCGYPNFMLNCSDKGAVLAISNDVYIIKNISYANNSLLVANAAVYEESCPTPLHNINLDRTPFTISPGYTNISFFYNCTSKPKDNYSLYNLSCATNSTHYSFVGFHLEEIEMRSNYSLNSCHDFANAPIHTCEDIGSLLGENYREVLKMGFLMNWTAHNCSTCERSGGRCGFENNEFICFCRDRPRPKSCDAGTSLNVGRKVAIGLGASIGTLVIMLIAFFFWYRRKKRQYESIFSRSIKSVPSSKAHTEKRSSYNGAHLFSYEELEEATNNFDKTRELGDGGFGTVYYGKLPDGLEVAVKRLYENNYKRLEQFLNEVDILTPLRHQNLVLLHGCTSRDSRELLLVYQYIPNGTLADHLHGERAMPGALPWSTRMNIAVETACALAFLHASDIVHRDVKTSNILLDNNFCVKVADFGLSRLFPTDVTHVSTAPQGTPGYVDPEYHQCYQLTDKSDVYSFGVVLIELISSMPAVDISRHRHEINLSTMAINKIQSNSLNELVDPSLGFESDYAARKMIRAVAELAFQCLQNAKELRPSMEKVLEILKEIQSRDYNAEKAVDINSPSDDVGLLKSGPIPPSPDTVTVTWISTSSTPHASV